MIFKLVEYLNTLFIIIVKSTEIRFEPLCERISGMINNLYNFFNKLKKIRNISKKKFIENFMRKKRKPIKRRYLKGIIFREKIGPAFCLASHIPFVGSNFALAG